MSIQITDSSTRMIRLGGGVGIQIYGPSGPCAALNWRYIGADYWSQYQACIAATIAGGGTALDTLTTPTGTYPGSTAYLGGVLLPDGRVFCVPYSATTARIYNPTTDTLTTPTGTYPGSNAYAGGVLLPDGRVFCVPRDATTARIYANTTAAYNANVVLAGYFNKL